MAESNLYTDIKESVIRNLGFLKSYGFTDFEENQLAYEFHFECKNDYVSMDIWFEAIASTPIWIKINQYYLDNLEPENAILRECERQRSEKYDALFQRYLKENNSLYLEKIKSSYREHGKAMNELYLMECAEIIKRNIQILTGDLHILKLNTEKIATENHQRKALERIKNQIYTLEYQLFPQGSVDDAYEEFSSLDQLYAFLAERDEIVKYRILDWNMNVIKEV